MKQFDDIFRQQAEKAFSGYNADHLADAGWKSFIKKQKRKTHFAIVIPLWAKAASVAIFIMAGSYMAYRLATYTENPGVNTFAETSSNELNSPALTPVITDKGIPAIQSDLKNSQSERASERKSIAREGIESKPVADNPEIIAIVTHNDELNLPDSSSAITRVTDLRDTRSDSLANTVFEDALKDLTEIVGNADDQEKVDRSRNTTLMAGLSGMMARVDNAISSTPGVAMGFYVDRKISKKVSFRPGLTLAMHSIDVNGGDGGQSFDYTAPANTGWTGQVDSYEARLNMIVMEIPMNLVFTLWEREDKQLFLTAGASTMIYLSQHFEGSFLNAYSREELDMSTGSYNTVTNYSIAEVESDYIPLSHADYLGLANISAGYSLPFGKRSSILIEPFIQLPLSELTSRNVKIRYGGLSMKLTFGRN